jgi:hypothetical protein
VLANEIREEVVYTVSKTGGHLSSSLGVAELTVALHHVFNSPEDKIIWDVGHQVNTNIFHFLLLFSSWSYIYIYIYKLVSSYEKTKKGVCNFKLLTPSSSVFLLMSLLLDQQKFLLINWINLGICRPTRIRY